MSQPPVTAEDLSLYAMGLLNHEEHLRLKTFLEGSPEARAELERIYSDLSLLALSTEQQQPSASARQRLLNELARQPRAAAAEASPQPAATQAAEAPVLVHRGSASQQDRYTPQAESAPAGRPTYAEDPAPRRSIFSLVLPWAGWAVAAGLAVTTYTFHQRGEVLRRQAASAQIAASRAAETSARAQTVLDTLRSSSAQRFVLTRQSTPPAPSARVTYLAESGSLVFQGNNLEPLPDAKTYELWLIPKGEGAKPIPAGTFRPDERGFASVILPALPHGVTAATFGVTMEDEGGSQAPTLPILMIGA